LAGSFPLLSAFPPTKEWLHTEAQIARARHANTARQPSLNKRPRVGRRRALVIAMHDSIRKAREILACREQQEAEFEQWREEHADELATQRLERLMARVNKDASGVDVIYKRNDEYALQ
jgi:hypothetical protein